MTERVLREGPLETRLLDLENNVGVPGTEVTVSALKALDVSGLTNGDARYVKGYYSAYDGAMAKWFRWDALAAKAFTGTASDNTFTSSAHGFTRGKRVVLYGGSLPTGVAISTSYYVTSVTTNTFKLAATWDDAFLSTPTVVDLTADGSGAINLADDGGTVIVPDSNPQNGRWQLMVEDETLWLEDFGAVGDNTTDDTARVRRWLEAALDHTQQAKRRLRFGYGQYKVTEKIKLVAAALHIKGMGAFDPSQSSSLNWWGNTTDPMFEMHVRECVFEDFIIKPETPLYAGVRKVKYTNNSATFVPSKCHWERVAYTTPASSGTNWFTYNIELTSTQPNTINDNNEYHVWRDCMFAKYTEAAIHADTVSQAHNLQFYGGGMSGISSNGKHAIKHTGNGGNFKLYGVGGGYHSVSDFRLGAPHTHIRIQDWNSENSVRLLTFESATQGAFHNIEIVGGRWATNLLPSDGEYIVMSYNGPLSISHMAVVIRNTGTIPLPRIGLRSFGDANNFGAISHKHMYYELPNLSADIGNVLNVVSGNWEIEDGSSLWVKTGISQRKRVPRQATIGI